MQVFWRVTCVEKQQQTCLEGAEDEFNGLGIKVGLDVTGAQGIHPPQLAVLGVVLIELLELLYAINHLLRQRQVHMLPTSKNICQSLNRTGTTKRNWS